MRKFARYLLFIIYVLSSLVIIYFLGFVIFQPDWSKILIDWTIYPTIFFFAVTIQEFYHWAKIGRRSESSDIIFILFFLFLIFFFTKDLLTSIMGSFSIYLWFGVYELKDYPIINKILIISLVTYNIIFVAGLVSAFLQDPFFINTAFAFSFWIILLLGFLLFGRKYIVVWRFMSPAYLTLFLYIIAWLVVIFVNQYTPIDFNIHTPLGPLEIELIYPMLIGVNWMVYFISGPILDKMLGIKRVKDEYLLDLVENVKKDIGIKGKVKVGFGTYPILNAMAYGAVFDKRIAIIAESKDQIPEDELKGIVAHELAHTKGRHTLILTVIATIDLVIRMVIGFPATYYDYTFGDPQIPMIYFIFFNILIFIILFIFVRYLEAKADLKAKKAGYSKELAKALYNLESFYVTGREFGLNTMLLCDEKITRDNQLLDYNETAQYLYKSMIKPSRGSLLANIMNSHPPSYFRIAALLGDQLSPCKEAFLPFICLSSKKQIRYAKKFQNARKAFKLIANEKFKEKFDVEDISVVFENLNRREAYKFDINQDFIFKNKITNEMIVGKLENVKFLDDVCDSDQYVVINSKTNQRENLNVNYYTKNKIDFNETYYLEKDSPLILEEIALKEKNTEGEYIFLEQDKKISKSLKK
ncbi:MAG: M48 family metalloprotease, partial [Candidatus Hermodarchaeota archaeon]